jgi:multiple sugar transport system permease protein
MFHLTLKKKQWLWAYLFLLIPMIFFIAIRLFPTLSAFRISLFEWNPLATEHEFIQLENYQTIYEELQNGRSATAMAFKNTAKYVLIGMPIQLILALFLALRLNAIKNFQGLFRLVFFLPFITSTVAISWVFRWLYSTPYGPINVLLSTFGLPTQKFLFDPNLAIYSILAVVVWQGLGYCVIIFLAGLKQIPRVYYEAAQLDGANRFQELVFITLPLLNNSFVYLFVLQTIGFLRMFAPIVNMTTNGEGGPLNTTTSIVLRIYREGFSSLDMGYASALSVVLFVIIMTVTAIQLATTSRSRNA